MLEFCNYLIHFKIGVFRIITSSDNQEIEPVNKKHDMQTLTKSHLSSSWWLSFNPFETYYCSENGTGSSSPSN